MMLILLFIILFLVLSWRRLDWAVMFLIAALPAYLIRFKIFGLPLTFLEVMIWMVFLVWFLKNYQWIFENLKLRIKNLLKIENCKLKIYSRYPFDWEIILLLVVSLLAVAVGGFTASAFGIWKAYFFEPVLIFIVVVNLLKYNPNTTIRQLADRILQMNSGREKILWALAVSALAVSALAIYQKLTGALIDNPVWAAAETRRVVSFFGYPNAVGLYLGPIVMVMVGWLASTIKNFQFSIFNFQTIFNYKIFKIIFIALIATMSLLSIYFAHSKGALVGVAAGLVVFGLLAGGKVRWATLAVVLVVTAGIAAYQPAREALARNLTLTNLSGQIRKAGWLDCWRMLKDGRLITGAGLANYQTAVASYHTEGIFIKDYSDHDAQRKLVFNQAYRTAHWQPLEIYLYPHNIMLNFWSELGLAGLLLFIWIIGKYFGLGIRNQESGIREFRFLNVGLLCAMVVIVAHGIVDVPYFKNDLAVLFWLLTAMMGMINYYRWRAISGEAGAGG